MVAFSSLCAPRAFVETDLAHAFTGAYARARVWVRDTPAERVAEALARHFPGTERDVLARTIAAYQALGCWGGPLAITRDAYEVALDVFAHSELITRRHPYDAVVVAPPTG
jgi:NitT/TauT family transport system substrate-binding protein